MNSVCRSSRWVVLGLLLLAPLASAKIVAKHVWMSLPSGQRVLIDWGLGELVATGQAVPPTNATTPGQKQLLARRGAVLDAQRNLLEALEGVQVSSDSTMVNFMAKDVVRTQVEGAVLAAVVTSESWDPTSEIYTVEMTMPLQPVRAIAVPAEQGPLTPSEGAPTGIVINLRGLDAVPSLTFNIYTADGALVVSGASGFYVAVTATSDPNDVADALSDARVADDPFVVKAEAVAPNRIDVIVDPQAAQLLREYFAARDYLGEGRVLIVVD